MRTNHTHLKTLGVSHPSLEMIVAATAAEPFGLATKLTGAGGGGCAVTLIPDGQSSLSTVSLADWRLTLLPDFSDVALDSLLDTLRNMGFEPHLTSLGGPGVAVLASSPSASTSASATKQSTDQVSTSEGDKGEGMVVPKRAGLRDATRDGLEGWATGLGQWYHS